MLIAAIASKILAQLNITFEKLPPKAQKMLQECARQQSDMNLDPISISLEQTRVMSESLEDEYEILKLKQLHTTLQVNIDRNKKFIDDLRKELAASRHSLGQQKPNPENIHESIRQLKQKLGAYEQSCEKAKTNFSSLNVSDAILPKSMTSLVTSLAVLSKEAAALKQEADDVLFMREAVDCMKMIR
ncbi:unnamed protein product [Leptosia nina]|uniref:Uncharacterized protein n=1 Tax=Leptosia nina TaxID=320188 RepID=A0AAV1IX52_9NEOP